METFVDEEADIIAIIASVAAICATAQLIFRFGRTRLAV